MPFFQISLKNRELKNNPQYLSGLSRALYPTTILRIAVYYKYVCMYITAFASI